MRFVLAGRYIIANKSDWLVLFVGENPSAEAELKIQVGKRSPNTYVTALSDGLLIESPSNELNEKFSFSIDAIKSIIDEILKRKRRKNG